MEAGRPPLVIAAAVLIGIALAVEVGARLWIAGAIGVPADTPRPGLGIPSLAAVDVLLLVSMIFSALGFSGVSPHLIARLNGLVVGITSLLTLLASLLLVFVTFALLMLMVGLLLAPLLGTAAYMAVYGHFDRGEAAITLAVVMILKVVAAICAVLGGPQLLKSKNLVLLFATSIGLTFLLSFLHGFPPRFLVSITDAVGALIAFVCAIIWGIAYLIGAISALLGNLQLRRRKPDER